MIIHNPILTGSFVVNGTDVSSITGSSANLAALNTFTASAATTGSNTFVGNQVVSGSLTVSGSITTPGTLTAQTLVVQTITSSVDFVTGSTRFGSILGNTHVFSGSVTINPGGLFVSSSGYVGIGTNNPSTHASATGLVVSGTGGNRGIIEVWDSSVTASKAVFQNVGGITYIGSLSKGSGTGNMALLYGGDGSSADVGLFITGSNGFVGIGTTTPSYILDIRDSNTSGVRGIRVTSASNTVGPGIFLTVASGNNTNWVIGNSYYVGSALEFIASNSAGGDPGTAGTARMLITSGGNVGIGTTSPSANLQISGFTSGLPASSGGAQRGGFRIANSSNIGFDFGTVAAGQAWIQVSDVNNYASNFSLLLNPNGGNVGIRTSSPRTSLQVTPVSNGETPVLGTATGAVTFTSANTNYGIQFNSTSDGSYFIQSQRFDSSATAYPLGLNPVGSYVWLGKGWGASNHRINLEVAQGNNILVVSAYSGASNDSVIIKAASGANPNATTTVMEVTTNSSTGRSISAGGTINASGNDYAEYIEKEIEDNIAKGDIVGINSNAKLTNIFADAVSFVVKSTNPSYVGGDAWGNEEAMEGKRPERTIDQTEEEFAPILAEFEARLEIERAKVDRIAFSGQVPCNVTGANVGDYIIPIELENGKIGGQAITTPTFEQYQISVGKVWKIMEDGRAWIAVKIG